MRLVVTAICFFALSAAGADRTLNIRNANSEQSQNELAVLVRALLEIPSAELDVDRHTLSVTGTESQISAAEWLLTELDKPAPVEGEKPFASRLYRSDGLAGDSLRIFYVQGGRPAQQLQEAATIMRTLVEIRRLLTYNQAGGIAVRGTAAELEAAEWVWRTVETGTLSAGPEEFRTALPGGQKTLRAYRMPPGWSLEELQESATLMRSLLELRRLFTYTSIRTILIRDDDRNISAATWLAAETARPASRSLEASGPFRMEDPRQEGEVRVFRLPQAQFDPAGLQRVATDLRRQTLIRRIFTFNTPRLIAVRGTVSQIVQAERLLASFR